MLDRALAELEARCRAEAPGLLEQVRTVAALVAQDALGSGTVVETVSLAPDAPSGPVTAGAPEPEAITPDRFVDLGHIASGGMGEVRRVHDPQLRRVLAMKLVRADIASQPSALERFVQEAQVTAQLQHPGIVPVHVLGRTADGRLFFTMREVKGRTLTEVIGAVHAVSQRTWSRTEDGWTLQRLVSALHQASLAVAYAHERGVVHRDLKPDNVMVGAFGEVLVMDWGLARIDDDPLDGAAPIVADRSDATATRAGSVTGTPAYMPPEQARGALDEVDPRADVYALGAILYHILAGARPYGGDARVAHSAVLAGPPEPLRDHPLAGWSHARLPPELVDMCRRAMARERDARYPSALALAEALESWLDGSARRERALGIVAEAAATEPDARRLQERATRLREEASALLAEVPSLAPEAAKLPGWRLVEQADLAEQAAALKAVEREMRLHASLSHAPDLPEAHAALAQQYAHRHREAEADQDPGATARAEVLLREHVRQLPTDHPVRQDAERYLVGDGAVTLVTDPPGAEVACRPYVRQFKRLVEGPETILGTTPLVAHPLPRGSHLLLIRAPGRAEVRYPVFITRNGHWKGVRPGDREPFPIWLPPADALPPDACYIPAGWFDAGGVKALLELPRTRLWCDPFVIQRFPVTNRRYLLFLNGLVARGEEARACWLAPRERPGAADQRGAMIYGRDADGRFVLVPDADGDLWDLEWPVFHIDREGAMAYAAWAAEQGSLPWRLPWDLEWEKAARGVDGRIRAWGDGYDATYACNDRSHAGPMMPQRIDTFPIDCSPYGVRGTAGGVWDWTLDLVTDTPSDSPIVRPEFPSQVTPSTRGRFRGGSWSQPATGSVAATRQPVPVNMVDANLGFRLAASVSPARHRDSEPSG